MNMRVLIGAGIVLFFVIAALGWIVITAPAPQSEPTPSATSTPSTSTTPAPAGEEPLSARVSVSSPASGTTVGKSFAVVGEAPGNWYFEASFPIQVRDKDNNKIGQTIGQAQSDWMTTAQVPFSATMTLDASYSGPATLVLLRDNPSGLPENDDAVSIPIVIQ